LALKIDPTKRVYGWEYMDLVGKKLNMELKCVELRRTCGHWPEFAQDIDAVVFFGAGFGEVFLPQNSATLCPKFNMVPREKDYLAIEVLTLETLYERSGSSEDQNHLTSTGIRWQRSINVFESCPKQKRNSRNPCKCDRIQEFAPHRALGKVRKPGKLSQTGAVIFGKGKSQWLEHLTSRFSSPLNDSTPPGESSTAPTGLTRKPTDFQSNFESRMNAQDVVPLEKVAIMSPQFAPRQPRLPHNSQFWKHDYVPNRETQKHETYDSCSQSNAYNSTALSSNVSGAYLRSSDSTETTSVSFHENAKTSAMASLQSKNGVLDPGIASADGWPLFSTPNLINGSTTKRTGIKGYPPNNSSCPFNSAVPVTATAAKTKCYSNTFATSYYPFQPNHGVKHPPTSSRPPVDQTLRKRCVTSEPSSPI